MMTRIETLVFTYASKGFRVSGIYLLSSELESMLNVTCDSMYHQPTNYGTFIDA